MTGLEKIKDQILEEARQTADKKKAAAQAKADGILRDAREAAAQMADQTEEKSRVDAENYQERIKSACDLKRRTMILEAKQQVIAGVIAKAYEEVRSADTESYFAMMEKLLAQSLQKGDGKLYFSAEDLARMPEGFEEKAAALAGEHGGSITVEKETRELDGGFVLAYGGIEENCTLHAMFHSNRERLQDLVHEYLWRKENG